MDIRSIMAILDGGAESKTVLTTAIELGRRFDALTAMVQFTPPAAHNFYPVLDAPPANVIEGLISKMNERSEQRRHDFYAMIDQAVRADHLPTAKPGEVRRSSGFAITSESITGHENREIAERGRLYDLIVIGVPDDDCGGLDSTALEAALLDTARPVLITCRYPRPVIGGHITVAWDGSREAAQSIRNAVPLMHSAGQVEIVHIITGPADKINPADVVKYLKLHDIEATSRTVESDKSGIADRLLDAARENGHALLVMGAYGTSAVAEYMFGGVTRNVMSKADVPLLVSH